MAEDWRTMLGQLRAVLLEEGEAWSAQCLDYDIAAQAQTLLDLHDELARVLVTHIAASIELGREPFSSIKPAPERFWELYEHGLYMESKPNSFTLGKQQLPPIKIEMRVARSPTAIA
jgi:hypothetical protein